jgi:hypothetical protein
MLMQVVPVEETGAGFQVIVNGRTLPLRGPPLIAGWSPVRLLVGPRDVSVLQLHHQDGRASVWFMDSEFSFIANEFSQLSDTARAGLVDIMSELANLSTRGPAETFTSVSEKLAAISLDGVKLFSSVTMGRLTFFHEFWAKNDYLFIENALTPDAVTMLRDRVMFDKQNALDDPRQFYRIHNDEDSTTLINRFMLASVDYYEAILGINLLSSYAFAMKYIRDSDMDPHYDNYNNPISSTVCFHSLPENVENPLYLDRARFLNPYTMRLTVKDRYGIPLTNVVRLDLKPGDIAIFRGRNHLHWRDLIREGLDYRALLLHFCDYKYRDIRTRGSLSPPHIHTGLIDIESYDDFRRDYIMFFEAAGQSWV